MTCVKERSKFLAAALGALALVAWSVPARADSVRVRNIRVSETAGDTAVVIGASARPTFTTWKLEQPARVVIELSGARLGDVDVPMDAGTYAVGLVSASVTEDESAGPRTRIVLTLRQASDYRVESKGNDITLRVVPHTRPPTTTLAQAQAGADAQARAKAEAQLLAESKAKTEAQAQAKREGLAKADAEAKAQTETKARVSAQARAEAESKARREAQAKADAEALARREAQARAETEAEARREAQAKAESEAEARQEAQAKAESETKARREAQAKAESEAKARREAQAKAESEAKARREAQARAEAESKLAAQAKAQVAASTEIQRETEAKLQAVSRERQAAQALADQRGRAEAEARSEAVRLRRELDDAQRETARARATAHAAVEESQRQKVALALAEGKAQRAQADAERARGRADTAEREVQAAQKREADRDQAVRLASQEVENRQRALDRIAKAQDEQRSKLASAERLVEDRESKVRSSERDLVSKEERSRAARATQDSLTRDASAKRKAEAAALVAQAERQRQEAAKTVEQARQALASAVSARKQEESQRELQTAQRIAEESKLEHAVAQRKAEEARLAEARAERARLDDERGKLAAERNQLENSRAALLAELKRLKSAVEVAEKSRPAPVQVARMERPAKVAQPASSPSDAVRPAPAPAAPVAARMALPATNQAPSVPRPAAAGRPRSITLHALARIRNIDFVDEPNRASVIIDVDDSTAFRVERTAGRRLSLRIEHSDLPDSLARHLDATEFLGPVKIISSYRDPAARSTVRVDVDLAEDVPNRVRVDGNRIYWDFQKNKAPSLPAVLFIPSRKIAGFSALLTSSVLTAQAGPPAPAYLAPPGSTTGIDSSNLNVGSAGAAASGGTPAASASGGPQEGRGGGASPRYGTLGKKRYTGRRIDLDFKGADIHNILRLLADVGQVNVIVADDVRGDVTIKMRDVPWDQALDVVLRSKGLGSVREGNLLRVAPLPLLEKELEAEIARQKQIADVLPTETRLIGVSYAEAGNLVDKARDLLTPRGKISVDSRTNTMVVSDVPKSLQLIEDLVRNLDTQTSQVVIEARIVEANSNFARQLGVQWGGTGFADTAHGNPTGLVFPYNIGIGGGADDGQSPLGGLVPGPRTGTGVGGSPNFLVNMPVSSGLGTGAAIGLTMGSVAGAFNLNLRLSAMETTGQVRILSSPRITTMDNVEAHISQGVSIPVSVVSAMGAQTQFVDAKLQLSVKPHVTNEGTISLVVNVTRNEPDFVNTGARGDPSIQKKEAKTTMLVRDGDTAVIGGIYTRNTGLSNARVPFFSDIPVLGWFFRNRRQNDNRSEFMVFITPRIVNRARIAGP
jgi:type IV pilus assembly protein PilQ